MIGQTISHYKILEKLGEGGMGVVYKAEDTKLNRTVALKFLPSHAVGTGKQRARFVNEARAAAALDHPNICTVHEIDTVDDHTFIAMACVEGESLESKIEKGPLGLEDAIRYATEICDALGEAHTKKIVHRDIKPANVMISAKGRVILMDFGLAKLAGGTRLTQEGATPGTVDYMSPEQTRGDEVDHRTDIWSVGVVLYQMISGRVPFTGDHSTAVVYSIVNEDPEPLTALRTGVPMELERLVDKMLSKSPGERYQHVDEIVTDLNKLKRKLEVPHEAARTRPVADKRGTTRIAKVGVPSLLVLLLIVGFFLLRPFLFDDVLVSSPKPIAVISFENLTGESEYDYLRDVIPNLLITSLEQSKHLSVVTWERMHDLLKQLGRENTEVIDKEIGFELCQLDDIDAIVLGSFTKAGDVFVTDVKVLDVHTKKLLKSATEKGEGVGSILESQIDELGREISRGVGIPERSIEETTKPITDVTTSSMEAYNYYLRGREDLHKHYLDDARRFLEKAVELDSTFAVAYIHLAWAYSGLRFMGERQAAYERAKGLSYGAPEKDRLYIEAFYAFAIENDSEKFVHLMDELAGRYPKEKQVRLDLGSYYYSYGLFDDAIEQLNEVLVLDPTNARAFHQLAYVYAAIEDYERAFGYLERYAAASPGDADPFDSMGALHYRMGKLDEAVAKFKEALEVRPDFGSEQWIAYIHALREEPAEAVEWINRYITATPSPGLEGQGYWWRAFYHTAFGNWSAALDDLAKAETLWEPLEHRWGIGAFLWVRGWTYFEQGEFGLLRKQEAMGLASDLHRQLGFPPGLQANILIARGMVDVKEGRIDSARKKLETIESLLSKATEENEDLATQAAVSYELFHAEMLLAENSIDEAISVCEKATPIDTPLLDMYYLSIYNVPSERDVLARALVRKGEVDKAIEEYERLITFDSNGKDRGLIYPKYHYRLAKLYEEKGLREKAANEYEKFLEICEKADAGYAEIANAKDRLSALSAVQE